MSARCPVTQRACSTAYGHGCRCHTCRRWKSRKRLGIRPARMEVVRYTPELEEAAIRAFRTDPGFLFDMLEDAEEWSAME